MSLQVTVVCVAVAVTLSYFALGQEDIDSTYGKLIFSSILWRHGDRNPESIYPNDPYNDIDKYWPEGLGQLTQVGKNQHYELGVYIRKRYGNFLPLKYNKSDVYVHSSDADRCLMSAEATMLGLYPPTRDAEKEPVFIQTVPIHTMPRSKDKVLFSSRHCKRYRQEISSLEGSEEYQCVKEKFTAIQRDITKHAGLEDFDMGIYDTLRVESLHNLTIPSWAQKYYPYPLEAFYTFFEFTIRGASKETRRLSSGELIGEIVDNMVEKYDDHQHHHGRKLYMYSAHESTVSKLLLGLDVHNGQLVPYSAAVFVELRENKGKPYVLISYRNSTEHNPYVLKVPGCDVLCPLDEFVKITKNIIPENLHSECNSKTKSRAAVEAHIPVNGIPEDWQDCFPLGKSSDGLHYIISYRRR